MKRFLCIFLAALLTISMVALTSCGETKETLKFGVGVVNSIGKATDATEEKDGAGEAVTAVAAVLLDKEGKIVKCVIDTADSTVNYTTAGEAVAKESFKTKYELGNDYGMSKIGKKEWFEQIDALCATLVGKTLAEVKAMVVDGGKGNDTVVAAGCTIGVADYILAVEKAINAAVDSDATAKDVLQLGFATEQSCKNATEEKDGTNELDVTFAAAVTDADGKVVAAYTDCVVFKFTFDMSGASTVDTSKAVSTKKELGENYGMSKIGKTEWNVQAEAFEKTCVGKTAAEVLGFNTDASEVQTAGCTVGITGLVAAMVKAATVK